MNKIESLNELTKKIKSIDIEMDDILSKFQYKVECIGIPYSYDLYKDIKYSNVGNINSSDKVYVENKYDEYYCNFSSILYSDSAFEIVKICIDNYLYISYNNDSINTDETENFNLQVFSLLILHKEKINDDVLNKISELILHNNQELAILLLNNFI
jgi:hypothetical protein